mmetsp:Transcript_10600/g.21783  ORF Transcript_10600/g.21783 Transcript_10600/m.21783 type:complete len:222 (+) Transcript_10600:97-762(+)
MGLAGGDGEIVGGSLLREKTRPTLLANVDRKFSLWLSLLATDPVSQLELPVLAVLLRLRLSRNDGTLRVRDLNMNFLVDGLPELASSRVRVTTTTCPSGAVPSCNGASISPLPAKSSTLSSGQDFSGPGTLSSMALNSRQSSSFFSSESATHDESTDHDPSNFSCLIRSSLCCSDRNMACVAMWNHALDTLICVVIVLDRICDSKGQDLVKKTWTDTENWH